MTSSLDRRLVERWMRRIAAEFDPSRSSDPLEHPRIQSAALALRRLAGPNEPGTADVWASVAILDLRHRHRDQQTRYFALIALGRIGGSGDRAALLAELRDGLSALEKPWVAPALGLAERARIGATFGAAVDREIVTAIGTQLDRVRNPDARAAFAVSLGLCRARGEIERLLAMLGEAGGQDELSGYVCIGLALLDDIGAALGLRKLVAESSRRPLRLLQASIALGRRGDRAAALELLDRMRASQHNVAAMRALVVAIGMIGDHRVVGDVVAVMKDERLPALSRALAAVALGGVADKELEPRNAKIGRLVNYRAAVEPLTDQAAGMNGAIRERRAVSRARGARRGP